MGERRPSRPGGPRAGTALRVLSQAGDTACSELLCLPTITKIPSSQNVYVVLVFTPQTLPGALPPGAVPQPWPRADLPTELPLTCPVPSQAWSPCTRQPGPCLPRRAEPHLPIRSPARRGPRAADSQGCSLTFPEVFTPFHRLKYSRVTTSSRQDVSCQRGGPRSSMPWLSCRCSTPRLQGEGGPGGRCLPPTAHGTAARTGPAAGPEAPLRGP